MADERETYVLEAKVELDPGAQAAINTLNQNTKLVKQSMNELRLAVVALGSNSGDAARAKENLAAMAKQMTNLGTATEQTIKKVGGGNNQQIITNLSFQFQDLTTQITGGTDALRAMSQQLPQMAMGFGPMAAIVATVIGIGAALAPAIIQMTGLGTSFKSFADAVKDGMGTFDQFDKTFSNFSKTADEVDFKSLIDGFNKMTNAAKDAQIAVSSLDLTRMASEYRDAVEKIAKETKPDIPWFHTFTENLFGDVKLTPEQKQSIVDLNVELTKVGVNAENAGRLWKDYGQTLAQGKEPARQLLDLIEKVNKGQLKINEATEQYNALVKARREGTVVPGGTVDKSAQREAEQAIKAAEREMEQLKKQFEGMWKGVRTPDEVFADSNAELDELINKLGGMPIDQVERLRASFEKTRDAANEALRVKDLNQFEKGYEAANKAIQTTADSVDQLNGKLFRLEELRAADDQSAQFKALVDTLGKAAPAMDQVTRAAEKLAETKQTTQELNASVEQFGKEMGYSATQVLELKKAMGLLSETKTGIEALSVAVGQTLSSSVSGFVDVLLDSEKDFKDWAASLIQQIGKVIVQLVLMQQIKLAASAMGWGGLFGAAKGNAFPGGMSLTQGIYNDPTLFKFAQGGVFGRTGVLAEAGPEAVVPLKRTAGGDLGVQASPVNITVNNYTDSQVTTSETTDANGNRQVEILIEKKIKSSFSNGTMDQTMRDNYSLSRTGRG